jgi:hypothetical protein
MDIQIFINKETQIICIPTIMAKDAILEQQGILPILKSLSNKESFQS